MRRRRRRRSRLERRGHLGSSCYCLDIKKTQPNGGVANRCVPTPMNIRSCVSKGDDRKNIAVFWRNVNICVASITSLQAR